MTLIALDEFDRADNTATLGSLDLGGTWTLANGAWGIIDKQAYSPTSVGSDPGNVAVVDLGESDVDVEVNVSGITTSVTGALAGLVFRYSNNSNFWRFVVLRTGEWFLHKFSGGTRTNVASGSEGTSAGVIYRAVLSGSSITLIRNDIVVYTTTDSHNSTATKHGITRQANAPWRLDNFVAYDSGGRPSVSGVPLHETFTDSDNRYFDKLADTGQTWDRRAGLPGVSGNQFYGAAGAASIITFDTASTDHDISAELRASSTTGAAGVVARYSDHRNYWRGIFDGSGNVLLQKQVGGTFTTYTAGPAWSIGDVLKLDTSGTTVGLFLNDTLVVSATDSFNQTKTLAGVLSQQTTAWRLDNVSSGLQLLLGPTVGYIGPGLMA